MKEMLMFICATAVGVTTYLVGDSPAQLLLAMGAFLVTLVFVQIICSKLESCRDKEGK